jgi:hypothetical protein
VIVHLPIAENQLTIIAGHLFSPVAIDRIEQENESFEYFAVVPNSRKLHQNARGYHHAIDEWWDDTIAQQLIWLFQRKSFDVLFVNYTFLAKAFEYAPPGVIKILDTHHVFSGRRELFEKFGVAPEFFDTSTEWEKIALDRADAVIAIKQSEAAALAALSGPSFHCRTGTIALWKAARIWTNSGFTITTDHFAWGS